MTTQNLKQEREQQGAIVPASKKALVNGRSPVSAYLAAHGVGMAGTFAAVHDLNAAGAESGPFGES